MGGGGGGGGGGTQQRILTSFLVLSVQGLMSENALDRRSIPFMVHNAGTGRIDTKVNITVLPSVYMTSLHATRSPRPSPPVFEHCK